MKKLFAVLGDPIGHSMSPIMHNDLFSFYNIGGYYLPFQVKKENLQDAVQGLKALGPPDLMSQSRIKMRLSLIWMG